uniref:nSTAND1 domain-containing NTPase n=1 Tax=Candidatus Electronema sp. TaxID=2698783 RepID=UPI004055BB4A
MTETATRKVIFGGEKQPKKTSSTEFKRSLAIVIGIDCYSNGIPPLTTAVNDASRLARILETQHGYSVTLLAEDVTKSRLEAVFKEQKNNLSENDRLLFYFAGHGVALDCDKGPEGYLIPQDADQKDEKTFWKMTELHKALEALSCRHLLAILDCCFAGAFRWSSKRDFQPLPSVMHRERYERFLRSSAWQVVTSAAHNQKALDVLCGNVVGERGHGFAQKESQSHSPFALSLFEALKGAADLQNDGVVTATELYIYLRDQVEVNAEQLASHQQTPGLWPLNKHRHGEFIFLVPGGKVDLPPAPDLTEKNNPYKGLSPYEADDSKLFFGRTALVNKLKRRVEKLPFTVVLGASGTGKSSLVKAGLIPSLKSTAAEQNQEVCWRILPVMRPDVAPLAVLRSLLIKELPGVRPERKEGAAPAGLIGQWSKKNPGRKLLLVIDQFEELITLCRQEQDRQDFVRELRQALAEHGDVLRIVLTLRSDFQAQIAQNYLKDWWQEENRFIVPPMTQNELREVIEQPASVMVLYFEPHALIDRLINEVIQTPGALPLLSFTLSELYLRYVARRKDVEQEEGDRALTEADYEEIGGVIGSLRRRIDQEYESLDDAHKATMRRILLRMVAFEGGGLTRRRVPKRELKYPDAEENKRVDRVVAQLSQARLIVEGSSEKAGGGLEEDVEPAHDALIVAWDKLLQWQKDEAENMLLHRQLTRAAADWEDSAGAKDRDGLLWDSSPRLLRAQEILEQKWSRSRAVPTAGQKSFRGLRQFWKVLFPTFKHLEQHIWLNRVETDFVRRSVEKKRNWTRGVSASITGAFVVLGAITLIAWWQREKAVLKEREARYQLSTTYRNTGFSDRYKQIQNPVKALHYLSKAAEGFAPIDRLNYKNILLSLKFLQNGLILHRIISHNKAITGSRFNKEGNLILTWGEDGIAQLWDSATGKRVIKPMKHIADSNILGAIFSGDESCILTWGADGTAKVWNSSTGDSLPFALKHESIDTARPLESKTINGAAYTSNGSKILTWSSDHTARLWDSKTGESLAEFKHQDNVIGSMFNNEENKILTWSFDGTARLWDISTGKLIFSLNHDNWVYGAMFDQDRILTWGFNGKVRIWNSNTGKEIILSSPIDQSSSILNVWLNSDASQIWTRGDDGSESKVRIWDSKTGKQLVPEFTHDLAVIGAKFNSDQSQLLTWSRDGKVRTWDTKDEKGLTKITLEHKGQHEMGQTGEAFMGATFNSNDRFILTWSKDGTARIWNSDTGQQLYQDMTHSRGINGSALNRKENKIATWSDDGTARIWNTKFDNAFILWNKKSVIGAKFNNDGTHVLTWSQNGMVSILNSSNGDLLFPEIKMTGIVDKAIFSVDESMILAWDSEGKGGVWDSKTGIFLASLTGHTDKILGVKLSHDGQRILTWSSDYTARIWDINTGKEFSLQMKHDGLIYGAAFNPDETKILTWSTDKTLKLWDSITGNQVSRMIRHTGGVDGAIINNIGDCILTWSSDNTVRLWNSTTFKEEKIITNDSQISGANFSSDDSYVFIWTHDGRGYVFDIKNGKKSSSIIDEDYYVGTINGSKFNSDASRILTWKSDGTARLWDAHSGEPLTTSLKHDDKFVQGAEFNSDENQILTWTSGNSVRIWDATTGEPLTPVLEHYDSIKGAEFDAKSNRIITFTHDGTLRLWDISIDTDWPTDKLVLKTEVETGTILDETGELKVLGEYEWQSKKCEYDKIQYQFHPEQISKEEWQASQSICKRIKSEAQ